jgi:large subunit ribosomal protein L23
MADLKYYDVILKPIVTEKSMAMQERNCYVFLVHVDATKNQIKEAVEKMFDRVTVQKVNTMRYDGKPKRRGYIKGRTAARKKAVVQLTQDSRTIEIYPGFTSGK